MYCCEYASIPSSVSKELIAVATVCAYNWLVAPTPVTGIVAEDAEDAEADGVADDVASVVVVDELAFSRPS
jgi:hypothetical protein